MFKCSLAVVSCLVKNIIAYISSLAQLYSTVNDDGLLWLRSLAGGTTLALSMVKTYIIFASVGVPDFVRKPTPKPVSAAALSPTSSINTRCRLVC